MLLILVQKRTVPKYQNFDTYIVNQKMTKIYLVSLIAGTKWHPVMWHYINIWHLDEEKSFPTAANKVSVFFKKTAAII